MQSKRLRVKLSLKDSAILDFANKIKEAERVLDMPVDDYSDYRRPKRVKPEDDDDDDDDESCITTVESRLNLADILSYAHRVSYTTFAPPEFGAGQAPLRGSLPPAPQEEQMRASQLYNFADLDVGLPKTVDTKEKTIEPIIETRPPPQPVDANPLKDFDGIQGLLPLNITVPSGWKPGMPVELPKISPLCPHLDGNLGMLYHCLHWMQFLCLELRNNHFSQFLLMDYINHLSRYKFGMLSWIFWVKMMTVVIIAVKREALKMMVKTLIIQSY